MTLDNLKDELTKPKWAIRFITSKQPTIIAAKNLLHELTSFLNIDACNKQRASHVLTNNYNLVKCIECGNPACWAKFRQEYSQFCSQKCAKLSSVTKNKIKATNLERYGTEYCIKSPIVRDKIKSTNLERYGVEHIGASSIIQDKIKSTNLERYGVEYSIASEIIRERVYENNLIKYGVKYVTQTEEFKEKIKTSNLERYGVESTLSHKETQDKIAATNMEKYGVVNPFGSTIIQNKIKTTNLERYGVEYAVQSEEIQQKKRQTSLVKYGTEYPVQNELVKEQNRLTNLLRYGKHHTQQHLTQQTLDRLNMPEWLIEQHHKNELTITEIADLLGIYDTTLNGYFRKYNIETRHFFASAPERELGKLLTEYNINYDSNTRKIITPYELDIYLPDHNLAIEYCGLYWHSELRLDKDYHKKKRQLCKNKGIRLIQIFEHEWLESKEIVKSKLLNLLNIPNGDRLFARKTVVADVSTTEKIKFLDDYHIQGNGPSSINIGLKYNDEVVAVMGFINNNDHYILNRYATSKTIVGGFSKLLKYFERQYNNPMIRSFADLRWSEGNLYYKTGFTMDKELEPDYFWTTGKKLYHKFNFRHKGMKTKLKNYDSTLSETENMHNHGYYKIYDCGKLRFVKNVL